MPHDQKQNCQDKYDNRNTVDTMHERQVDITFAAGIAFAENIDICQKFAPDHNTLLSIS